MKKILLGASSLLLIFGLASCGNDKPVDQEKPGTEIVDPNKPNPDEGDNKPETEKPELDENKVLVDNEVGGYAILGPDTFMVGDKYINAWGGFDGSIGKMEATSVKHIRELNADLGASIATKNPTALYFLENIHVADTKVTGNTSFWGPEKTAIDQAYNLKCGSYDHDAENDADAVATWIPSKESGKVISLTPDTYWITDNFQEEKDENEYDWNTNPAIIDGAGVYTMVLTKFAEPVEEAGYGIGMIKTEAKEEAKPTKTHTGWKLTGTLNEWNAEDVTLNPLTNNSITLDLEANTEFKVTKTYSDGTGSWGGELGFGAVIDPKPEGVVDNGGNILVTNAGKYTIEVTAETKVKITLVTDAPAA